MPRLPYVGTPNQSTRTPAGRKPHLLVIHAWGNPPATTPAEARSRFLGNVAYMQRASVQVSAHVVYGGCLGNPKGEAAQLVPWNRKAWTQAALNSACLSIESADAIWHKTGHNQTADDEGFAQLARIAGFICKRAGIPPTWSRSPSTPGVTRHADLGALGNPSGHVDPTLILPLWRRFLRAVEHEYERGDYIRRWGRGTW